MNINRDSFNNLLKLTLILSIVFSAFYSASANAIGIQEKAEDNLPENSGANGTESNQSLDSEKNEQESDSGDLQKDEESSQQELPILNGENETSEQQKFFTIKNILLLFTIIDLPVFALLLALWFLDSKQKKQELKELAKKQNSIIQKLDRLNETNSKLNNLDIIKREIISQVQENNQKITDSKIEVLETIQKKQVYEPVGSHNNINSYSNNYHGISESTTEQAEHQLDTPSHTPIAVIEHIPQFVDQYNQDKQSLSNEATARVSATEASLNKRRMGDESKLILENTPQKRYLVIQDDSDYFLVPHAKIKINEHNISSLEALFECINFTSEYSDFHLIQPAKVSQLESELWQLEKKGKLEFS